MHYFGKRVGYSYIRRYDGGGGVYKARAGCAIGDATNIGLGHQRLETGQRRQIR